MAAVVGFCNEGVVLPARVGFESVTVVGGWGGEVENYQQDWREEEGDFCDYGKSEEGCELGGEEGRRVTDEGGGVFDEGFRGDSWERGWDW